MQINSLRQVYNAVPVQAENLLPISDVVEQQSQEGTSIPPERTVDMRSVSLNEINALIKSGVNGLLDKLPFIPLHDVNGRSSEYAANVKIDYLGQIEGAIDFQKRTGKNTDFLEAVLENVRKIDGMKIPVRIDVVV